MKTKITLLCIIILGTSFVCSAAFAKNDKQKTIPPGLQKKVERGKELPPGWQKKIARGEVLDLELYKQGKIILPADINGISTIKIGDKKIKIIDSTREIVDILDN